MRRLNLAPYPSHLDKLGADGKPTGAKLDIQVQSSLVQILFASSPKDPLDFIRKAQFADRLEQHVGATINLEEPEWTWLVEGVKAAGIKERQFVELVRRVMEAESVDPNVNTA